MFFLTTRLDGGKHLIKCWIKSLGVGEGKKVDQRPNKVSKHGGNRLGWGERGWNIKNGGKVLATGYQINPHKKRTRGDEKVGKETRCGVAAGPFHQVQKHHYEKSRKKEKNLHQEKKTTPLIGLVGGGGRRFGESWQQNEQLKHTNSPPKRQDLEAKEGHRMEKHCKEIPENHKHTQDRLIKYILSR